MVDYVREMTAKKSCSVMIMNHSSICSSCLPQLKSLTDNLKSRDEVVAELQKQHEEQLSRLTQLAKERDQAWTKQKDDMEQHYTHLLNDLQSRTKVIYSS